MRYFIVLFLFCLISVLFARITPAGEITPAAPDKNIPNVNLIVMTPREFLKAEVALKRLSEKDFLILQEIIQCESGWEQKWNDGTVKISKGNVGLAQINFTAHREEILRLKLNIYDEFDNLRYAVILYQREFIRPWDAWSGHCFRKNLKKIGIEF